MAIHWESKGAERLHVVDLNGAVTGKPVHRSLIEEIARSIRIPVEVGGGIRDLETIENYLSSGVRWVILGTVAFQNPGLLREASARFPGRIILSLDAKRGKVAIQGWNEIVSAGDGRDGEAVRRGVSLRHHFTDIERDGIGTGVNWELTKALAQVTSDAGDCVGGDLPCRRD